MTSHEGLEELIPIYALGALDGEELRKIEEHLRAGCSVCQQLLQEQESIVSLIPHSVTTPPPAPTVKERLFKSIQPALKIEEKSHALSFWERFEPKWFRLGEVVAVVLLILLVLSNIYLRNRVKNQQFEISSLQNQTTQQSETLEFLRNSVAKKESELTNLKQQLASGSEITEFLRNPDVVVINLVGLQPSLKAHGRVLWDTKNNKAYFYGLDLPPTPSGKTYQLWAIANNTPVDIGIFKVDEKGNSTMRIDSLVTSRKIEKFAVTLEPDGGVPQPTGDMYLIGES